LTAPSRSMPLLVPALIAAPVLGLVSELVVPRDPTENATDELALIASHSTAFLAANLVYLVAATVLAAGAASLVAAARGHVFLRIAGSMVFVGALALVGHAFLLLAVRDLAVHTDQAAMASADATISEGVGAMVLLALRFFSLDLGITLVTVAAWRARLIPGWAAPLGFLALAGDFSPWTINGILFYLGSAIAFGAIAVGVRRKQRASVGSVLPVAAAA
jgi:hypothetical protein